ncbi:MAG: hypothetical protein AAGA08_16635 [Pseudomonadota bacterium]
MADATIEDRGVFQLTAKGAEIIGAIGCLIRSAEVSMAQDKLAIMVLEIKIIRRDGEITTRANSMPYRDGKPQENWG